MAEEVAEAAGRLGAPGAKARAERVGHDEVPVAAEPRLCQRLVRGLAVEQPRGEEERAVLELPLRGRDRTAQPGLEPLGKRRAAAGEVGLAGLRPDPAHRAGPATPSPASAGRAPRRECPRSSARARAGPSRCLRSARRAHRGSGAGRGRGVDVRAVARQPVVERRADEPLAHLPVRIRRVLARQRRPHDRPGDAGIAELSHHLGDVDALRERELLVGVADAVPPGEQQVLNQQVAVRVVDALLGTTICVPSVSRARQ